MEKGICFPIFLLVSGFIIFPVSRAQTCRSVFYRRRDTETFLVDIYALRGNPAACDLNIEQNGITRIGSTCYLGNLTCRNNDEDLFKAEITRSYATFLLLKGANKTKSRIRCYRRNSTGWYLACPQTILVLPGDELISPANGTDLKPPLYRNPTFVFKVAGFPYVNRTDLYYRNSGQYQIVDKSDYDLRLIGIGKQKYELYNLTLAFPVMIRDDTYFRLDIGGSNETIEVYFSVLVNVKPEPLQLVSPPNNTDVTIPDYYRLVDASFVVAGLSFRSSFRLYRQEGRYNARCTPLPRSSYDVTIFKNYYYPRKQRSRIALKIRGISQLEEERYCLDIQVNAEKIRIMFTTLPHLKLISPANSAVLIPPVCRNPSFVFTIAGFPSLHRTNLYYTNSGQYKQLDKDDYDLKSVSIGKPRYELYNLTLTFPTMIRDDTLFRMDVRDWNNTMRVYFSVQGSDKTGTFRGHEPLQLVSPPNNTDLTVPSYRPLNASFVVAGLSFPSSIRLYRQEGKNNVRCTPIGLSSSRHVIVIANDCDNPSKQQANVTWKIDGIDRANEKGYCLDIQVNAEKIRILFTTSRSPGPSSSDSSNSGLIVAVVLGSSFSVFLFLLFCCLGLKKWRGRNVNGINQRTSSLPLGGTQRRPSVPLANSTSGPFTVTNSEDLYSSPFSYNSSRLSHTEVTRPGHLHRTIPPSLASEPPSYESVMGIPSEPPPPYPGDQKPS